MIPLQLMTAGNILSEKLLVGIYQHIGAFLPAPNAMRGFMKLIYQEGSVSVFIINLLLISIVCWAITLLRLTFHRETIIPVNAQSNRI